MKAIVICSAVALCTGCASVEVEKLTADNRASAKGIRYWRPALYLAVSASVPAGEKDHHACSGRLIYLPDPSEEYVMRATAGFGSATLKPTLTDGWNLTAFDSSVDSKTADVLGAFAKIVTKKAESATQKNVEISPGLYRIKMDPNTGALKLDSKAVYEVGEPCATLTLPQDPKPPANPEQKPKPPAPPQ